mmetsp:Transcript_34113/g.41254  ORF Transcript_34113/g.41254 Transcript_34113/m.41254 type:complete len:362 (+) Transcript_34113:287-1372(+)
MATREDMLTKATAKPFAAFTSEDKQELKDAEDSVLLDLMPETASPSAMSKKEAPIPSSEPAVQAQRKNMALATSVARQINLPKQLFAQASQTSRYSKDSKDPQIDRSHTRSQLRLDSWLRAWPYSTPNVSTAHSGPNQTSRVRKSTNSTGLGMRNNVTPNRKDRPWSTGSRTVAVKEQNFDWKSAIASAVEERKARDDGRKAEDGRYYHQDELRAWRSTEEMARWEKDLKARTWDPYSLLMKQASFDVQWVQNRRAAEMKKHRRRAREEEIARMRAQHEKEKLESPSFGFQVDDGTREMNGSAHNMSLPSTVGASGPGSKKERRKSSTMKLGMDAEPLPMGKAKQGRMRSLTTPPQLDIPP